MSRTARDIMLAILVTFVALRASLQLSPNSDFNVAGYNVHHLFTGVLVMFGCAVPLVLGARNRLVVLGFGVGAALCLDEVVYLIATDGTNASYLSRVSWWGGVVTIVLGVAYVLLVDRARKGR